MPDFPGVAAPPASDVISAATPVNSIGDRLIVANVGGAVPQTFPAANRAVFTPFIVGQLFRATVIAVDNGGTVNGNCDVGIYDAAGNRRVSKGSTAQTGASGTQSFDITDTDLEPGRYYIALASSSGTATFYGWAPAIGLCSAYGILQMASAFALPATATYAACTAAFIPGVRVQGRTLAG